MITLHPSGSYSPCKKWKIEERRGKIIIFMISSLGENLVKLVVSLTSSRRKKLNENGNFYGQEYDAEDWCAGRRPSPKQ